MNDDARWTLRQLESLRARPEVISRALAAQERAWVDVTLATDDARRFLALEREVTRDLTGMEEASARASALARACAREMREARALVERSRRKLIAAGFGELSSRSRKDAMDMAADGRTDGRTDGGRGARACEE